jgi:hypothetical protein
MLQTLSASTLADISPRVELLPQILPVVLKWNFSEAPAEERRDLPRDEQHRDAEGDDARRERQQYARARGALRALDAALVIARGRPAR